jgi:DNA-binding CsgD family transcriptional regulator
LLVIETIKTYERTLGISLGLANTILFAAGSFAGSAMYAWFFFRLVSRVLGRLISAPVTAIFVSISALLGVLGGLKEVVFTFVLWNVDYVAFFALHLYGAVLMYRGLTTIESHLLRSLVRSFLIFLAVFAPIALAQLVLQNLPRSPSFIHDWPLEEILYYLGFVSISIFYLAQYFLGPSLDRPVTLDERLLQRFGISKREADIISMMNQGLSNRAIGEKLYISASTVKNHIYHIYRKTGVDNKIQLFNLINPPK